MSTCLYYRLIDECNSEISDNNRMIKKLKESLGDLIHMSKVICDYEEEFTNSHILQKTKIVDIINSLIGCGRYSNNILIGLGNNVFNIMTDAGDVAAARLNNTEEAIQDEIKIIKGKINDLNLENNEYYRKIDEFNREILRIEKEEL